jgi:hypothetical protein
MKTKTPDPPPGLDAAVMSSTIMSVIAALFRWSDTPVGIIVDPIPNPRQFLVVLNTLSLNLGDPGVGIKIPD